MNIKEAYAKARETEPGLDLLEIYNSDDVWIFEFGSQNEQGMLFPGALNVTIDKKKWRGWLYFYSTSAKFEDF